MLRTLLKPRWLGLLAVLVVVLVSFTWLGLWQLAVARDQAQAKAVTEAPSRPVAPISSVIEPHQNFPADGSGRRVTATGRYDGKRQLLVAGRRLDGASGYWVTTPLVVQSTGARLVVVRGFVTDPQQATAPATTGKVTVSGTLAPSEEPNTLGELPKGQIGSIDLGLLLNRWDGSIYNAFIFATSEQPDATTDAIRPIPPPKIESHGLTWRNAAYALQWWVFAVFAAYMWWRMVRDDWQHDRAAASPAEPGADPPSGPSTRPEAPQSIDPTTRHTNDSTTKEAHV